MRVILFGGTDLTVRVAETVMRLPEIQLVGIVYVGSRFAISYAPGGVVNTRFADVRSWGEDRGVAAHEWAGVDDAARFVDSWRGEFGLAAGWYHMLPAILRGQFSITCAGLHASLLPRLRGGAPLNWAILLGHSDAGVTLFELGDGVDDGAVLGQSSFPLGDRPTIAQAVEAAEEASIGLVETALPALARGELRAVPQVGVPTYCLQRTPEDGLIEWSRPAQAIDRLVRAVSHPYPGAYTLLDGEKIVIWSAEPVPAPRVHGAPGQLLRHPDDGRVCVLTGDGLLRIDEAADSEGQDCTKQLSKRANSRLG